MFATYAAHRGYYSFVSMSHSASDVTLRQYVECDMLSSIHVLTMLRFITNR